MLIGISLTWFLRFFRLSRVTSEDKIRPQCLFGAGRTRIVDRQHASVLHSSRTVEGHPDKHETNDHAASFCVVVPANRAAEATFRLRSLGQLLRLTPTQFEVAIGDLLHDLGYRDIRRVGGAGDLAADLLCRDERGRSVVVQRKRYALGKHVGSPAVQSFIGMVAVHHHADGGIIVTTSGFTRPGAALARQHDIALIGEEELSRLIGRVHAHSRAGGAGDDPGHRSPRTERWRATALVPRRRGRS